MDYNISYRNKDKSIQCIISYKDSDGKWRQKSKQGFKRQKDAKPWISDTVEKLEETIKTPSEFRGVTFGEFKEIFLRDKKRLSPNTIVIYKESYNKFESLNDIPLVEIGYINIKPCVDRMIDDKLSNSTIRLALTNLKTVLNHAIDKYDIMKTNPVKLKDYDLPKQGKKKKIKALNEHEVEGLLTRLDGRDYMISLIACKCGLRIGEIVGLKDISFDFKRGEIKISEQWKLMDEDRNYGFGTLKTNNSYRSVPIPSGCVKEIQDYVRDCVIGIDRRIFNDKNTKVTSVRLSQKYKRKGYNVSVHDLRHTYATTLLLNGFDYRTVAELMGDTVEMIIKTYSHFIDDMMKNAKTRINKIL